MTLSVDRLVVGTFGGDCVGGVSPPDNHCNDGDGTHTTQTGCEQAGFSWIFAASAFGSESACEAAGNVWSPAVGETTPAIEVIRKTGDLNVLNNITAGGNIEAIEFTALSSRTSKEGVEPVEPMAILSLVRALGIHTWSYIHDPQSTPHLGPMAEDFFAAFGLGSTERRLSLADVTGVLLAAVQGLGEWLDAQGEAISMLEADNMRLADQNASLERRIARLERLMSAKN